MAETKETTDENVEIVNDLPSDDEVNDVIRRHALYGAAGGAIPIPLVDLGVVSTIQVRMITQLCQLYGVSFSDHVVKTMVATLITSALPRAGIGYAALRVTTAVPLIGPALGLATFPGLYGGFTWALGKIVARHFAEGGQLDNLDLSHAMSAIKSEISKTGLHNSGAPASEAGEDGAKPAAAQ